MVMTSPDKEKGIFMYTLSSSSHVDLWLFSITPDSKHSSAFFSSLCQSEQDKANKFHFAVDREKYIISHGIMRRLLSSYLGCNPTDISYKVNAYGKPTLASSNPSIHFNLTHSHDLGALAISTCPIGVDIEKIAPLEDYVSLTKHFLAPEERQSFQQLPSQEQQLAFYRAWTRKEAYIKGIGMGLSYPIDQVLISFQEDAEILEDRANPNNEREWDLLSFEHENYIGALTFPKNHYFEVNIREFPQ
jgi:4'-phosphopantetheinyl transferase